MPSYLHKLELIWILRLLFEVGIDLFLEPKVWQLATAVDNNLVRGELSESTSRWDLCFEVEAQ